MADYDEIVHSALDTIPECRQLEDLYPDTTHFITHYGMSGTQWMNSQVWLDNAMSITVQYEIDIDYKAKEVSKFHSPIFAVDQYREIMLDGRQYHGIIGESNNVSTKKWKAFIDSGGDVTFLGDYDKERELKYWDAFVEAAMRGRLILNEDK